MNLADQHTLGVLLMVGACLGIIVVCALVHLGVRAEQTYPTEPLPELEPTATEPFGAYEAEIEQALRNVREDGS
jgi:hypothetical protein